MLIKSLRLIVSIIYKYILPFAFTAYIFFLWQLINTYESRILLSCALIFFVRVENSFALYRSLFSNLFYSKPLDSTSRSQHTSMRLP